MIEGTWGPLVDPARLRVDQPDRVRVETTNGVLLHEVRQGSLTAVAFEPPAPRLDGDGLVTGTRTPWLDGPEVPMWQDYRFVAVLDPYELSDGVEVLQVLGVEHGGRPAWEALLRPGPAYEPRCACCPLLRSRATDLAEGLDPKPAYAGTHRVRLDVGTGVCVRES